MSEKRKETLAETLTGVAPLSAELRQAPRHRQEKKVKSSMLGLFIMATALPMFAFAGYLALRPSPDRLVLGATAAIAMFWFAAGAMIADPETVGPVIKGLLRIVFRFRNGDTK